MANTPKKRIYTVATAHLDTSWLWDLETTIREFIPLTLRQNFKLFESFPDYKFNFEGSYRYELMEEYYPELFERLKEYVALGRWIPVGSSYENGDVNTPSPEALFRNILYGSDYFKKQFGAESDDIYLPDCFGFGWALPSVAAHADLHGFATQKLTWQSAHGIPFEIGKWYGVDGNFIYASLNPGAYVQSLPKVRSNKTLQAKLKENLEKYGLPFTYAFYGTGDRGGAPGARGVKSLMQALAQNAASDTEIIAASATQIFDDIQNDLSEAQRDRLPSWKDELLLSTHGAGSYTSRAVGHRWNRRCEQLADAAERGAVTAQWLGAADYPKENFERAWKRVIAHQFHDDITGTSFQRCYKRNWNDYLQSLNQFAEECRAGGAAVCRLLDTSFVRGTAVVVNNPLQAERLRSETVTAKLPWPHEERFVRVLDGAGKEVPSQMNACADGCAEVAFAASVPSVGYAAYDVQPSASPYAAESALKIARDSLENAKLKIHLDRYGDIDSIIDKASGKELLSAPIRLAVLDNVYSKTWPAWEIKYEDVQKGARAFASMTGVAVLEDGPARVALEITKYVENSQVKQILSLDRDGGTLRVYNEVDWRSTASLLKAEFPLAIANPKATYDLGLGAIERGINTDKLYEVPAQTWADITNLQGDFGVSVFSDSRSGWDKPNSTTLRLTAVHTPIASFRWESSQHLMDLGLNRFSFGIFAHEKGWQNGTQAAAACFQQPMNAFVTTAHPGALGRAYSFAEISDNAVLIRAIKQAENSDEVIVRFNEGSGIAVKGVRFHIGNGIAQARELFATEAGRGEATVKDGALVFDMKPYEPKTFALTLVPSDSIAPVPAETFLDLPFNTIAVTANGETDKATTPNGISLPKELWPESVNSGGVNFRLSNALNSALICRGQTIPLPQDGKTLHLLAASLSEDVQAELSFDGKSIPFTVQSATEAIGAWDLIGFKETGYIKRDPLALTLTHTHGAKGDEIAKQFYLFRYSFAIPEGATNLTLPLCPDILLFAATVTDETDCFQPANELYDSLEKRPFDYVISKQEEIRSQPTKIERFLDRYFDRDKVICLEVRWGAYIIQLGDAYNEVRKLFHGK